MTILPKLVYIKINPFDHTFRIKKKLSRMLLFSKSKHSVASYRNAAKKIRPLFFFFIYLWVQPQSPHQANLFVLYCLEWCFTLLFIGKGRKICTLIITTPPLDPYIPLLCHGLRYLCSYRLHWSLYSIKITEYLMLYIFSSYPDTALSPSNSLNTHTQRHTLQYVYNSVFCIHRLFSFAPSSLKHKNL